MSALRKLGLALRRPVHAAVHVIAARRPGWVLANYSRLARDQGIDGPRFLFSFDCDTDLDIDVVEEVHARLAAIGIRPSYAVPGELLERGASVYRRIAATGAEFLNHGYATHTRYHAATRTYESTFFYDQLSPDTVRDDIRRGHETHRRVLGRVPLGFRVPHFGTYQESTQLAFLHRELSGLGYRYSSSTVPRFGLVHGPVTRSSHGVWEVPVSGCFDQPTTILDSWGFRHAAGRRVGEADYVHQFRKMLEFFSARPGVLNYYADPSQVYDWPAFFEVMASAAPYAVASFEQLLDQVERVR